MANIYYVKSDAAARLLAKDSGIGPNGYMYPRHPRELMGLDYKNLKNPLIINENNLKLMKELSLQLSRCL